MLTSNEIHGMLVNQLKEELKSRDASTAGKKAELAARLEELVAQEAQGIEREGPETAVTAQNDSEEECTTKNAADEPADDASIVVTTQSKIEEASEAEQSKPDDAPRTVPDKTLVPQNDDIVVSDACTPKQSINEGYTHVRIDNFQRPLNQKALIEWIESQCQCTLAADAVWINSIKTHCYVDFTSEEEAKRCVENVSGKKYPSSSPYILEADFTSVSAKEAPQSVEGSLKPGAWKVVPGAPLPTSPKVAQAAAKKQLHAQENTGRTITVETEAMDTQDAEVPQSSNKRKLQDATASSTSAAAADTPSNKTRRVAGLDIFRRATAGILLNRPGNSSSAMYDAPASTPTTAQVVTGFVSRKAREDVEEPGETHTSESGATRSSDDPSLEDLFKKTVTATPALYWLPAPDEVVQQRLKSRLLSRAPRR